MGKSKADADLANSGNTPRTIRDFGAHSRLVTEILIAIGARPDCRVWKNATGTGYSASGNFIKFGKKGSADIIGLTSDGKFLAIECKTGQAVQSKEQRLFQKMIERFSGRYIVARNATDVVLFLDSLCLLAKDVNDSFRPESIK